MRILTIAVLLLGAPLAASAAGPPRSETLGRADLPRAVDNTFARQAGDNGLAQIRRVTDAQGRTVYSAQIAGTGRTVEASPNGLLLARTPAPPQRTR